MAKESSHTHPLLSNQAQGESHQSPALENLFPSLNRIHEQQLGNDLIAVLALRRVRADPDCAP